VTPAITPQASRRAPYLLLLAAPLASIAVGWLVPSPAYVRMMLVAGVLGLWVALVVRAPRSALYLLVGWLATLGLLRRLLTNADFAGAVNDPLLLVAPAVWGLLAAVAFSRGALRERTALTGTVLILTGLLTASALNPLQGELPVGLAGFLLVVSPMLAFWVGRSIVDDAALRRVLILVAALALPAAGYGLLQAFTGFPPWDARWIAESGYTALYVGGNIRGFASFASGAEYATFVAIGIVVWLAFGRRVSRLPLAVASLVLLGSALWLESARSIIVLLVVAVCLMLAARRRLPLPLALAGGTLALLALPTLVGYVAQDQPRGGLTGDLVAHQVQGLADPFGQASTLPVHITMVTDGVMQAVSNPIGTGVGSVTSAAARFGGIGGTGGSTEADPGNVAVAAGALGLVTYVALVMIAMPRAYRVAARGRDPLALAALGILAVTFLQWLNGAQYAVAPLPWLILGWLDQKATSRGSAGQAS